MNNISFIVNTIYKRRNKKYIMIHDDTIKLLRECDQGIEMGISSIDEVYDYVYSKELKNFLKESKNRHLELKKEINLLLDKYHDDGKSPNPFVKGMSYIKTKIELIMHKSDSKIADLMTDGCNMGVKSLNKYLNKYVAASEDAKELTKSLIEEEETLAIDIRRFL